MVENNNDNPMEAKLRARQDVCIKVLGSILTVYDILVIAFFTWIIVALADPDPDLEISDRAAAKFLVMLFSKVKVFLNVVDLINNIVLGVAVLRNNIRRLVDWRSYSRIILVLSILALMVTFLFSPNRITAGQITVFVIEVIVRGFAIMAVSSLITDLQIDEYYRDLEIEKYENARKNKTPPPK